ncbi:MAG: hypothetical protein Q8927_15985 [Bacteroidota bacterium]|nr:hypothetical protein [Bacteroidota bacterium]MDP4217702.1 hypothetical protein [Bacteroidota bacterium]MDP4246110.1 hypothetical protein [Bacteroidota bacterium]MDP4254124.1 hypothetical protein [Bacteroidota bacterium]MDP4257146.1 hypothetical protein [Bacteroidota bacterium]
MRRTPVILLISLFYCSVAKTQDTLPKFSVTARGAGKILVSWHNSFTSINQISIQRSSDSLKNFTTLLTVPDPKLPENGVVDNKAPDPNSFYRLFIVLDGGSYLFSKSQRPHVREVAVAEKKKDVHDVDAEQEDANVAVADRQRIRFQGEGSKEKPAVNGPSRIRTLPNIEIEKTIFVKRGDSVIGELPNKQLRGFRDSILNKTKDTLVFIDGDTLLVKSFVPKEVYRISAYVFTGKYGNVHLSLPDADKRHYSVKFFDDTNKLMFELSAIKDPSLILDKTNFLHSGWFRFELYEEDRLKEKNKLFIPKDF